MNEILIVGSGFAAGVLALHFLESSFKPHQIFIVGPDNLGAGNAYGCLDDSFRLNVRAQIMWIKPDQREEFLKWSETEINDPEAIHSSGKFFRRKDFARFMNDKFSLTPGYENIRHIKQKVVKISKRKLINGSHSFWRIKLDDGSFLKSKYIILATGNPSPSWPCDLKYNNQNYDWKNSKRLIKNPWKGEWLNNIDKTDSIFFIGGGLTSLDGIYALYSREHLGPINVIAPMGKFPPIQADWERKKSPPWPDSKKETLSASTLLKFFRRYLPEETPSSKKWQDAWEELREDISIRWQGLSEFDQLRLKNKVKSYWSHFRYRSSPQTINAVNQLMKKGQLLIHKARLNKIISNKNKIILDCSNGKVFLTDRLINCSGAGRDKLISQIISDNIAFPDNFNVSLKVDKNNIVSMKNKSHRETLFMISPTLEASLGDVAAASEVSLQALRVVKFFKKNIYLK